MLDLKPIKERIAAATSGPWTYRHLDKILAHVSATASQKLLYEDATLIVCAPADLTALVAEVERLRKEIADNEALDDQIWKSCFGEERLSSDA